MAAVAAILAAIARSTWRSLRSVGSITGNNLFAIVVLMMAEEPVDRPSSTAVFYLLVGLLYAIPLASELSRRIPPVRLALWPISRGQRITVNIVNLVCNPLFLMAVLFAMLSRHRAVGFGLLMAGVFSPFAVLAGSVVNVRFSILRLVPRFPGAVGGLIQNHLREILQMLDVYFAGALAFGGVCYRLFGTNVDPFAPLVLGQFVVILMSTLAQGNLGFDAASSTTRMHLLSLTGFRILFARDAAWFVAVMLLLVTYPLLPCVAAALVALAVGHQTVVEPGLEQRRWHFSSGRVAPTGLFQVLAIASSGATVHQFGWRVFPVPCLLYAASLFWYARKWDEMSVR